MPTEAAWLGDFKAELFGFPNVRYLDQVDALTQKLEWVRAQDAFPRTPVNDGPELIDGYGSSTGDWDDDFDAYLDAF